jgi:hypothetical protein
MSNVLSPLPELSPESSRSVKSPCSLPVNADPSKKSISHQTSNNMSNNLSTKFAESSRSLNLSDIFASNCSSKGTLDKTIVHLGGSNSISSLFSQQNRGSSNSLSSQFSQHSSIATMAASINSAPITVQHLAESISNEAETNTTEVVTAPKRSVSFFEKPTIIDDDAPKRSVSFFEKLTIIDDDDSDSSILQTIVFPSSVSMKEEPILEKNPYVSPTTSATIYNIDSHLKHEESLSAIKEMSSQEDSNESTVNIYNC